MCVSVIFTKLYGRFCSSLEILLILLLLVYLCLYNFKLRVLL